MVAKGVGLKEPATNLVTRSKVLTDMTGSTKAVGLMEPLYGL